MSSTIETLTLGSQDMESANSNWAREYRAFRRLLPQLLSTHRGHYVAVHEGQVIDSDADETALLLRMLRHLGNVDMHIGLVTEQPEPMARSGVVREVKAPVVE